MKSETYDDYRFGIGLPHVVKTKVSRKQRGIAISDEAFLGLQELSRKLNIEGPRGRSVSALVEAIGIGMLEVTLREKA